MGDQRPLGVQTQNGQTQATGGGSAQQAPLRVEATPMAGADKHPPVLIKCRLAAKMGTDGIYRPETGVITQQDYPAHSGH